MTVTVSGMTVTGKTRTLPKVSFALKQESCRKAVREQMVGTIIPYVAPCRLCNKMSLPAYSREQPRL